MSLALLGAGPAVDVAWTPAQLFLTAQAGAYFQVSNLATLFKADGTTPAAVGDGVGKMLDLSGNNNHAVQATGARCPILRNPSAGIYRLECDGSNDNLGFTLATAGNANIAQPWDRISAIQQISWTSGDRIHGAPILSGILMQFTGSPQILLFDGSASATNSAAAVGADAVVFERHSGAASKIAVDAGADTTVNPGTNVSAGWYIGADSDGTAAGNIYFYGGIQRGTILSAGERASALTWCAALQGRAL